MAAMRYDLEGKVALVTGGSRGIGLELARQLLEQKAKVAICARKPDALEAAREGLGGGDDLLAIPAHIAEEEQVERLFRSIIDKFGRLDVLVNNVGMNLLTPTVTDADLGAWRKIIDSNLTGTYMCSRRAAQLMRAQKAGRIISISSVAARYAAPGMGIYGVAKAGIEALTRALAAELAAYNVQVNAVAPSMVRTGFSAPFWSNEEMHRKIVATVPAGRLAEPIDVVHAVLFLASDAAGFITGQTLVIDGGSTAGWAGL